MRSYIFKNKFKRAQKNKDQPLDDQFNKLSITNSNNNNKNESNQSPSNNNQHQILNQESVNLSFCTENESSTSSFSLLKNQLASKKEPNNSLSINSFTNNNNNNISSSIDFSNGSNEEANLISHKDAENQINESQQENDEEESKKINFIFKTY